MSKTESNYPMVEVADALQTVLQHAPELPETTVDLIGLTYCKLMCVFPTCFLFTFVNIFTQNLIRIRSFSCFRRLALRCASSSFLHIDTSKSHFFTQQHLLYFFDFTCISPQPTVSHRFRPLVSQRKTYRARADTVQALSAFDKACVQRSPCVAL